MKFRPEADIFPLLGEDDLKALAADIDAVGQRQPISLYQGDILDGRNRYLAITRHCKPGLEPKFEDVSPESPIAFVISLNEQRRHLNDSQRKMAAARALPFFEAEAKRRQREHGGTAPGRPKTLVADLPEVLDEATFPEPLPSPRPPLARAEAGVAFGVPGRGVQQAKTVQKSGSKKLVEAVDRGALSLSKAEQITKLYPDKKAQDAEVQAIAESKMATRVKGLTGEVEWYTPRPYLDAAVAVMGGIDLDPASSEAAQGHVGAATYFTRDDDGLTQRWHGRVFLNPPYAMPTVREFTAKMVTSWVDGDMDEGILLTNNATDTEWFHMAARACAAVCFTRGRISFLQARDGELLEKTAPTHGQAFFYFGPKPHVFEKVFCQHGIVLYRSDEVTL
jgi:hypothetical protein